MSKILVACFLLHRVAAVFFVVNLRSDPITIGKKQIQPGEFFEREKGPKKPDAVITLSESSKVKVALPQGTAAIYYGVVTSDEGAYAVDTNDLQVALSKAAKACGRNFECIGRSTLGGVPANFAQRAFGDLWIEWDFWSQCAADPESPVLRTQQTQTGVEIEILREKPLVAAVRGFASGEECTELMGYKEVQELTRAHTGGAGHTTTSSSRETLTANMFVNWNVENSLTKLSVRTFDLVSELLGEAVPYEGQEPVNFLHYVKGYEYRPHPDGMSGVSSVPRGKRVASTLVYCRAADEGGGTVFPQGQKISFLPRPGDLLFFAYNPDPHNDAIHAACPVLSGNKTTLTQWHRLAVSIEEPWDRFENWGAFHNPHGKSRWKGPRLSQDLAKKKEL
eukprot:TRINITY_DN55298_c0_g1_i1.p1 TRINITY_DN55298_c0_g1~~TRINITY_DN55298_c0_g1_i1.p1  ORF type:complete len:416 (+),score=74.60 TRINITY_DN55298_c0_g1_i1:71-1249(+)